MPRKTRRRKAFPREVETALLEFSMYNPQYGGGSSAKTGIIVVDNKRFRYWDRSGGTVLGGNNVTQPCFILLFSRGDEAALQSVGEGNTRSMDYGATSRQLVRAAVALAIHRGAKQLTLTDNSTKKLPNKKWFRLSDMNMMTNGQTWYETIIPGLIPDSDYTEEVTEYRRIVTSATWSSISTCLGDPIDLTDPMFDGTTPGSAMTVFKGMKDAKTDFFADYRVGLLRCYGLSSLFGSSWVADLIATSPHYSDINVIDS